MTATERVQPWRRLAEVLQGALVLGLPFLRINGQSALRFDVPSLRLYFFGVSLWMDEFFIVLVAVIFLVFLFILLTLILGRIWCGWVCPQTVLIDYTGFFDRKKEHGPLYKAASYGAVLIAGVMVSASLIWYFVSPYEFFARLISGSLGPTIWWFWGVLAGVFFLDYAFPRHKWCATVCPYAKLQSIMFDSKTLVIAFDPAREKECMNCMACVRTCPVGIDIREGLNAACINCAKCIDECTAIMKPKGKKGLIGYFWGLPGEAIKRTLRTNALITGMVAAVALIFLVYLAATRTVLGLEVLPNYNFSPRVANGEAVNSFVLAIENRGRSDEQLSVYAKGLENSQAVPGTVAVKKGEEVNMPVYIIAGEAERGGMRSIKIVVKSKKTGREAEGEANFIFPPGR